jgi:hypothetical protein
MRDAIFLAGLLGRVRGHHLAFLDDHRDGPTEMF